MKRKRAFILLAILILVASSLACGLFNRGDDAAEAPVPTNQSSGSASLDESAEQLEEPSSDNKASEQSTSPLKSNLDLGDEYRSEEGGYVFQPIPDYEFEEFFGLATMVAPDADSDLGPILMLIGGINEEEGTSDEIFNNFIKDAKSENVEILDQKEITVDGKPGLLADITGGVDERQLIGRIAVVAVTPNQQFTLFATAPRDRWDEIEALFDAVLTSVHFFEPQEIDFTEESEEAEPDEGSSEDTPILDTTSVEEFPTEASQLPPGGFTYLLASSDGFPTIVAQGNIQDQSTSAEYVIGLVSEDQDNTLTLFIPLDVGQGIYPMNHYDPTAANKAPGAAIFRDAKLYTNTDGIIMIDGMGDNTITGSVYFTAVDEDGNEIAVTGFFNELPLAPQ